MSKMGKFLCVFSVFVSISFARTISPEDLRDLEIVNEELLRIEPRVFENKIAEALSKLKEFLVIGDPMNGIPPFDPYFLPRRSFDFVLRDTDLKGHVQNVTFANFSRFEPTNIEFKLLPLHFMINVSLDHFRIDGMYKLEGKILGDIHVNGSGKFISDTNNLTLYLFLKPTKVDDSLQIKDIKLEIKTQSEKIFFTNEMVSDEFQLLDENLVLNILDQVQEKYFPPLLNMVKLVLNDFLLDYTFQDILKIILDLLNKN